MKTFLTEVERRWREARRNAFLGVLGVVIIVALLQGVGNVLPGTGGKAAPVFLGCVFAITGAAGQIAMMRKDKTVVHLMRPNAPREFILAVMAADALFSLPFLALAVVAQTVAGHDLDVMPQNLAMSALAYALSIPAAWAWSCQAFSTGSPSSLTPLGLVLSILLSAGILHFTASTHGQASADAAAAFGGVSWLSWSAYLGLSAAVIGLGELLLLWWRQGGDLFV